MTKAQAERDKCWRAVLDANIARLTMAIAECEAMLAELRAELEINQQELRLTGIRGASPAAKWSTKRVGDKAERVRP